MHEHISLNLPYSSVSSGEVDTDILCFHSGAPDYVSLPGQLLVGLTHSVMGFHTNSIDVEELGALAVQLIDAVCKTIASSFLLVIVSKNFVDFLFNAEKFVTESIVGFTTVH